MKCSKAHRYAIATDTTISDPFDCATEAREFAVDLPKGSGAVWVAFHEVGVEQLVRNPDTVQTYCETETHYQEELDREARKTELKPAGISLKKSS